MSKRGEQPRSRHQRKGPNTAFNDHQRARLMEEYRKNSDLEGEEFKALVESLGITDTRKVTNFFYRIKVNDRKAEREEGGIEKREPKRRRGELAVPQDGSSSDPPIPKKGPLPNALYKLSASASSFKPGESAVRLVITVPVNVENVQIEGLIRGLKKETQQYVNKVKVISEGGGEGSGSTFATDDAPVEGSNEGNISLKEIERIMLEDTDDSIYMDKDDEQLLKQRTELQELLNLDDAGDQS